MAGLSSMTSTRRFMIAMGSPMTGLPGRQGQIEGEHGAATVPTALDAQLAAEFPGSQRPAVQPESMPFLLGRKSVIEDTSQVLGGDPDTIVSDADLHTRPVHRDPHGHDLVRAV